MLKIDRWTKITRASPRKSKRKKRIFRKPRALNNQSERLNQSQKRGNHSERTLTCWNVRKIKVIERTKSSNGLRKCLNAINIIVIEMYETIWNMIKNNETMLKYALNTSGQRF